MRLLVFVGSGVGNCIQTTPLIQALKRLGHIVDVGIMSHNRYAQEVFKGLCEVYFNDFQIEPKEYDWKISTFCSGGEWFKSKTNNSAKIRAFHKDSLDAKVIGEVEYNMEAARQLGFNKETPELYFPEKQKVLGSTIFVNKVVKNGCKKLKDWGEDNWKSLLNKARFENLRVLNSINMTILDLSKDLLKAKYVITAEGGFAWISLAMGIKTIIIAGETIKGQNYKNKNFYPNSNAVYIHEPNIQDVSVEHVLDIVNNT